MRILSPPMRPPTVAPWLHAWEKECGSWEKGKIKVRRDNKRQCALVRAQDYTQGGRPQ